MKVTMKDVAKRAGVAPSTVSRVISGNEKISEKTRKKVLQIMEEMDYHPNVAARNLANSKTRTLGLILPNVSKDLMHNPFFVNALNGISKSAKENGYFIMYGNADDEKDELSLVKKFVNSNAVDGIILTTVRENDESIEFLRNKKFPYITIGRQRDHKNSYWVDNDNFQAMYNVVEYLVRKNRNKIAFIGGRHALTVTQDRLEGYKKALERRGLKLDNQLIQEVEFSESSGYDAMKKICNHKIPEAVVATDDILAFGAIDYLREIKMDKKIAVIGFNNTPLAAYKSPSLTSVDISAEKLGYYAADLLIKRLNDEKLKIRNFIVDTKLVKRESTDL